MPINQESTTGPGKQRFELSVIRGTTISKSLLARFQLHGRDTVYLVETKGDLLITSFDPDFSEAMQKYQEGARAFRTAQHEVAI